MFKKIFVCVFWGVVESMFAYVCMFWRGFVGLFDRIVPFQKGCSVFECLSAKRILCLRFVVCFVFSCLSFGLVLFDFLLYGGELNDHYAIPSR